ncbi:MAG: hypothetical protein GC192_00755 [Bacteroidetes bacterium]|nr:hypothetical protein [Bacteroidota bacterium]
MKLVEQKNIPIPSEEEKKLRKIISDWAETIPHHPYQDFGQQIIITDITYCPSYEIELYTQYFSENDFSMVRPFRGETLNYQKTPNFNQIAVGKFLKDVSSYVIPGTEKLETCSGCYGRGDNECSYCYGKGENQCSSCSGKGIKNCSYCYGNGKTNCYNCNGTGKTYCYSCSGRGVTTSTEFKSVYNYQTSQYVNVWVDVNKRCYTCGGSGKNTCSNYNCKSGQVECSTCYGKGMVKCSNCSARGKITCSNCSGRGRVTCNGCEGSGKVVYYMQKTRKWDYELICSPVLNPTHVKKKYPNFKLLSKFSRQSVYSKVYESPTKTVFDKEPNYFNEPYKTAVSQSYKPQKVNIDKNGIILHQKVDCLNIPTYDVSYIFDNVQYSLLVVNKDKVVFEEFGPIEVIRLNLKEKGKKHLSSKNFGKGKMLLNKAFDMDPDDFDEDLTQLLKKAESKIKSSYSVGAFIGSFIWGYLITLLFVSNLTEIEKLIGRATNFSNIQELIIIGIGYFVSVVMFCNIINFWFFTISDRLYKKFGDNVKPELLRILLGIGGSLLTIIISAIIAFLTYKIGLAEFIGELIWNITDWIKEKI